MGKSLQEQVEFWKQAVCEKNQRINELETRYFEAERRIKALETEREELRRELRGAMSAFEIVDRQLLKCQSKLSQEEKE